MHRRLSLVVTMTVLAVGCGQAVDMASPSEDSPSTTTSSTFIPPSVTFAAANQPGGVQAAQAEVERILREEAAAAVLNPFELALQEKAEEIVERFRQEPGLRGVGADLLKGVVQVVVDDYALYDTLLQEFQSDQQVAISYSQDVGSILLPLVIPETSRSD